MTTELPRSIAVLPFKPLVAGQSDERLELGVTEALINKLSRIPALKVEPLAKVRRFGAVDQDPLQAGQMLGVDAVLEGHFLRSDGQIYVHSRILRTADGTALATNEWREPFADIFDVQDRIAESVTSALGLTLTPDERTQVRRQDTSSAEALRHYLFGRHHLEIRSPADLREAEREFREALRLDPQYAGAHAALALTLSHLPGLADMPGTAVMGPAREAALRALAIDDSSALAHAALARIYEWYEYDPMGAPWVDYGERLIYGIPGNAHRGFKLADDTLGPEFDPTSGDRTNSAGEIAAARAFLRGRFPALAGAPLLGGEVCQYENSPDSHFIVDRHPAAANVWLVRGGSGHGFKMGPALGEIVAGLVLSDGTPDPPRKACRVWPDTEPPGWGLRVRCNTHFQTG